MEDVLELYEEPYDPKRPVVCFDEMPVRLVGEARVPRPPAPGRATRYDYEYKRNGTVNLFIGLEPKAGQRYVDVTDTRTKLDFAGQMKRLVDERYPEAGRIRVVMDNLNTHKPASLYEAYAPAEAGRILRRLEFHYTPRHASWLNQAEIEWSVLSGQCLDRRIGDRQTLEAEVGMWGTERNAAGAQVEWRFTNEGARTKLHRLYPTQP
jgi:transposase